MGKRESDQDITEILLDAGEATTLKEAAAIARVSPETVRRWCSRYGIGRQIERGASWRVSKPGLLMVCRGDERALTAFFKGDRSSPAVSRYLDNCAADKNGGAA